MDIADLRESWHAVKKYSFLTKISAHALALPIMLIAADKYLRK
jgi:hypothetical protein